MLKSVRGHSLFRRSDSWLSHVNGVALEVAGIFTVMKGCLRQLRRKMLNLVWWLYVAAFSCKQLP